MPAYDALLARRDAIMRRSVGIEYERHRRGAVAWDYEGVMAEVGYDLDQVARIQRERGVGGTPLLEALHHLGDVEDTLEHFEEFFEKRRDKLAAVIRSRLGVSGPPDAAAAEAGTTDGAGRINGALPLAP